MDAEFAVVGVGSMGSFALWQLAQRGASVIGFEQFEPGHDMGSGHGESRLIRTAVAEGSKYVPLAQAAFPLWRQLEQETGANLLTITGSLMIGNPESKFLSGVLESAKDYQLPHQIIREEEARKLYPQHALDQEEIIFYEQQGGMLRPEAAIVSAARRAQELGAQIVRNTKVKAVNAGRDEVEICTGEHSYRVRHAIIAAGAWTATLLPQLADPLWVERQIMVWYPARKPELFTSQRFPIFNREYDEDQIWYGVPSLDGATVKVAVHHGGTEADPDTIDREVHQEDLDLISELVRKTLPDLIPEPAQAKVCMYTNTLDDHFVVGSVEGLESITMLGPMAGHGFKVAPIMGKIAADLATTGSTSLPVEHFRPDRFQVGQTAR